MHEMTHTGVKPFTCAKCDKAFACRSDLKKHEITYTGDRPFACSKCDESFAESSTFQKHERIHTEKKALSNKHKAACQIRAHFAALDEGVLMVLLGLRYTLVEFNRIHVQVCTTLCKRLVTFGTRLWPHSCVDSFMFLESTAICE